MAQVTLYGRVTADPQVKESSKQYPYVRFDVVETIGTKANRRTQVFTVCAFGREVDSLIRRGVQKDSEIRVTGSLELEEYASSGGRYRDKRMKIFLSDWDFADSDIEIIRGGRNIGRTCVPIIDGEREPMPE